MARARIDDELARAPPHGREDEGLAQILIEGRRAGTRRLVVHLDPSFKQHVVTPGTDPVTMAQQSSSVLLDQVATRTVVDR